MNRFFVTIDASAFYGTDAPTLEVLVGGAVVSSASIMTGSSKYVFELEFTGTAPTALEFRFNDASAEGGRSITLNSVQINGQEIADTAYISMLTLNQGQKAIVDVVNTEELFGRVEATLADFGVVTHAGTAGADTITATGNDAEAVIDAQGGNDLIRGLGADDQISAGAGNDRVFGEGGNDIVIGEGGNDLIFGGAGDDVLYGGSGNDILIGEDGNDVMNGGINDDVLLGDAGNDVLFGEAGVDVLIGGAGNDALYGDDGDDTVVGDAGDDLMYGGIGNDTMHGEADNDTIFGEVGDDFITGGAGNDTIDGGANLDFIWGGTGNDTISGGTENDTLFGDAGVDVLNGDAGDDSLVGGAGADTLNGGDGNDVLQGHGLDVVTVSSILFANPGVSFSEETNSFYQLVSSNVTFAGAQGVAGASMLNGVAGHLVTVSSATENAFVDTLAAGNQVWINASDSGVEGQWRWAGGSEDGLLLWNGDELGSAENGFYENWSNNEPGGGASEDAAIMKNDGTWDDVSATGTNFYVIEWDGSAFSDDNAADTLNGGNNDDFLHGHGGNDILNGDAGIDHIFGGAGNDTMNGGTGNDFIYDDSGTNSFTGGTGDDILDARFQTAVPDLQDQISTILSENAGVVYSNDTGNFYQVVNTTLDWDVARTAAGNTIINSVGGHLGTITTQLEHDFIVSLAVNNNTWLGGSDDGTVTGDVEGEWYWVDGPEAGTQFYSEATGAAVGGEFINWNPGQPNDGNSTQNYLYLLNSNDAWADLVIEGDGSTGFVTVPQYLVEWEGIDLLTIPPIEPVQGVNTMNGGADNDILYGGNGNDIMNGDADNDQLFGRDGNDTMNGGTGIDIMTGGAGSDIMNGGADADTMYALFAPGSTVFLNADFEAGFDGFSYTDGGFGGTDPSGVNITGSRLTTDGNLGSSASLQVDINSTNGSTRTNMSGSYDQTFNVVSVVNSASLSFAYRAILDSPNETNEDLFVYAEVDGVQYGTSGNNWVARIEETGGGQDTGWVTVTLDIGGLTAGNHTVSIGGLHESKNNSDEDARVRLDDVRIFDSESLTSETTATNTLNGGDGNDSLFGSDGTDTLNGGDGADTLRSGSGAAVTPVTELNVNFDAGPDGFVYADDLFLGTNQPAYASGVRITNDGNTANGALEVSLGGINNNNINNMSGGWQETFNVADALSNVTLTFAYRALDAVVDGDPMDNGENLQLYADMDGTLFGTGGNNYFFEILGSAAGASFDSGWTTVAITIGNLSAGNHTLSLGGHFSRKTFTSEEYDIRFDDLVLAGEKLDATIFNTLNGQDGLDDLYGSSGVDHFVFENASAFNDIDLVNNFTTADGDALDLSDILSTAGYNPVTDAITDFVRITDNGTDSTLAVDRDGTGGGFGFDTVASILGVTGLTNEATLETNGNLITA